jgi:hypothetical protein
VSFVVVKDTGDGILACFWVVFLELSEVIFCAIAYTGSRIFAFDFFSAIRVARTAE